MFYIIKVGIYKGTCYGDLKADQVSSCVDIGCMFNDSTRTGAKEADIGSFLCCSGDGLQEECTRRDIENYRDQFAPASRRTNSNQLDFMQHVARITFCSFTQKNRRAA